MKKFKRRIKIYLNGNPFSCYRDTSIQYLVNYLDFEPNQIILEYNSRVVSSNILDNIKLQNGDKIEIITIVGGG